MQHEKIIKDERGTIRIEVSLITNTHFIVDRDTNQKFRWDTRVWYKAPRKKNEVINDQIATPQEVLATKMELYEIIKPK